MPIMKISEGMIERAEISSPYFPHSPLQMLILSIKTYKVLRKKAGGVLRLPCIISCSGNLPGP